MLRCFKAVEDDVLVRLVGEDQGVELLAQLGDDPQLFVGVDLAGGVVGRGDYHRLGLGREGAAQLVRVEFELVPDPPQRHVDRLPSGDQGVGAVVFVERLEDYYLVPRVHEPEHGGHHRLGAAAGYGYVGVRVGLNSVVPAELLGYRLPQRARAPGVGVLVEVAPQGLVRGLYESRGRGEVGEALGHVDPAQVVVDAGHVPDYRLREVPDPVCRMVLVGQGRASLPALQGMPHSTTHTRGAALRLT